MRLLVSKALRGLAYGAVTHYFTLDDLLLVLNQFDDYGHDIYRGGIGSTEDVDVGRELRVTRTPRHSHSESGSGAIRRRSIGN